MYSVQIHLLFALFTIHYAALSPIENSKSNQDDLKTDCCLMGRRYAAVKQDFQHFIHLDQLNLDRRRKSTAVDQMTRQTNLVKLFAKIHLNHHFYTNSSICEINKMDHFRPLVASSRCEQEFGSCCLDEQSQLAIGIDLALRTRFKQDKDVNDATSHSMDREIEYSLSNGNEIRLNCNLLTNKAITNLSIGQSRSFDSCEACSMGIDSMDQFESCSMVDENRRNIEQNELWSIIFKQCCRIIHLTKIAETQGLIKIKRD